jgi:SAM-dependent methyltransferase
MQVTCADYVAPHLKQARSLGFETFRINFDGEDEQIDALADEFAEHFDLVVNLAAIEHIFNTDALLRFVHRVLGSGGYFLANTPNIAFLGYRLYSLLSGNRPFGDGHHVRFWDYRFLRTHLYLNGFNTIADRRQFYTPPLDLMKRAFRNRRFLPGLFTRFFYLCWVLQKLPGGRGLFTDELTVFSQKEDVPPVGFDLFTVRRVLEETDDEKERRRMVSRLKTARDAGWLDEHLNLAALVDGLS